MQPFDLKISSPCLSAENAAVTNKNRKIKKTTPDVFIVQSSFFQNSYLQVWRFFKSDPRGTNPDGGSICRSMIILFGYRERQEKG
jgi:hypothetical protein